MKQAFFIINLIGLTLMAYLCTGIMYKDLKSSPRKGAVSIATEGNMTSSPGGRALKITPKNSQQIITRRNLFHVLTKDATPDQTKHPEQTLEKTDLKLALWGTVTGNGPSYAVIEDKKTKKQSLFQVGDSIQGAKIKQIMRNKIILTRNGIDQILEVDTSQRPAPLKNLFALPNQNLNGKNLETNPIEQLNNDRLSIMKQIKIRPYFKNGEPNGLLLYGMKPGSPFQKFGLKNGDIVQKLNGVETLTVKDIQDIYQEMEATPEIQIVVHRQGHTKEILYNGQTNSYTVEAASNE